MADINDKLNELNNTKDSTSEYDQQDIQNNKGMAVLAYLSWLMLIPLFAAKNSKFARFHCNQGIVLAIVETIAAVICGILANIPLIGWIFSIVESLICLVCFIFAIIGIVNAVNGRAKELPIVGSVHILQ